MAEHLEYLSKAGSHYVSIINQPSSLLAFGSSLLVMVFYGVFANYGKAKPTLDPSQFRDFTLIEKDQLSENTAKYRFALPKSYSMLGLPVGQHISVRANVNGKDVLRSYTPTSSDDELGFFELVVKTYPDGNVSAYIGSMKIGDNLSVKGPKGTMRYYNGIAEHIGLIAGGTGLTPCLQVIQQILKDPEDKTKVDFIYGNLKESDILLREDLDRLAKEHEQFNVHYFLNEPPEGWKGGEGFITKEAIEEHFPKPGNGAKVLLCGPPPLIKAMVGHLTELGYDEPRKGISQPEDQVYSF